MKMYTGKNLNLSYCGIIASKLTWPELRTARKPELVIQFFVEPLENHSKDSVMIKNNNKKNQS